VVAAAVAEGLPALKPWSSSERIFAVARKLGVLKSGILALHVPIWVIALALKQLVAELQE
jgi:hypothetical protein